MKKNLSNNQKSYMEKKRASRVSGAHQEFSIEPKNEYVQPPIIEQSHKIKKRAWACPHRDKQHYGKGMCSNCYHLAYYYKRRRQNSEG